jgi:hypothetical protein
VWYTGADPGFQVRGEAHLKKIAPSGGRRDNFWGISCEKSRFYAKKSYFTNIRWGGEELFGVLLITDKEPCKFAVNKRQNTNYSFLPVTSKVSCIRRKRGQIICLQGNN